MSTGWVLLIGWNIKATIFRSLLLLNQVNVCEHNGFLVSILLVRLGPETSISRLLYYGSAARSAACATFRRIYPSRCRIRDDLSYIFAAAHEGSSKFLTGAGSQNSAFLSGSTSAALSLVHRNAAPSKSMAGGKKTLSCVAFADELFVFCAKLVPKDMKRFIVGPMDNVA